MQSHQAETCTAKPFSMQSQQVGRGQGCISSLMINISPHWVINIITHNSPLASQKDKTLCTVLTLLFATPKTVHMGPKPGTIWSMPTSHSSVPYSPRPSLQMYWEAFCHLLDADVTSQSRPLFFSPQSPWRGCSFPLSSLSTWPSPSRPSGLLQRSSAVTARSFCLSSYDIPCLSFVFPSLCSVVIQRSFA